MSFKYETFWAPAANVSTYVLNRGYLPGAANLYVADLSAAVLPGQDITGLRVNGGRAIRARCECGGALQMTPQRTWLNPRPVLLPADPNAKTVEQIDGMQIDALHWTQQVRVTSP